MISKLIKTLRTMLLIFCFLVIGWYGHEIYDNNVVGLSGEGNESDLFSYSQNLNTEVNEFWKYNLSNIKNDLTLEQLKEQGGVCWHYADYYVDRILNETSFYAKKVRITSTEKVDHEFTIASGKEGYCVLDQTKIWCFRFKGGSEE